MKIALNGSNSEESIYDVFNHKFLGEISDGTKMGRWSVGYYYPENVNAWFLVKTRETTQQIKLMALKKDYYFENNGYIKKIISIDNVSVESIKTFYKDCLANHKFPSLAEQSKTKKANDDYLRYFGKVK